VSIVVSEVGTDEAAEGLAVVALGHLLATASNALLVVGAGLVAFATVLVRGQEVEAMLATAGLSCDRAGYSSRLLVVVIVVCKSKKGSSD
jgi:hypothetical protein